MKKDLVFPEVKDVHIAVVKEWNEDFTSHDWVIYLINNNSETLDSVMVMTRGKHRDGRKTSTLRHAFPVVVAKTAIKIELIMEEVFPFINEFTVTYFIGNTLYDATFMAAPNAISEANFSLLPVLDKEGFLVK